MNEIQIRIDSEFEKNRFMKREKEKEKEIVNEIKLKWLKSQLKYWKND